MEPKTKKILYISIGVLVVGALVYLGYKWYQKNKNDKNTIPQENSSTTSKPGGVGLGYKPNIENEGDAPAPGHGFGV